MLTMLYYFSCITYMLMIIIIIGIFYLQVASSSKIWGLKPTCPEEQSKGIAVKSQMSRIK